MIRSPTLDRPKAEFSGYAQGNEGPQVENRFGWDVEGVEIRVILDFGAGFIDHRGWFQNAGA